MFIFLIIAICVLFFELKLIIDVKCKIDECLELTKSVREEVGILTDEGKRGR
jgi:hypothetical protein